MVFIETPASRAAWKTAAGAAETMSGIIAHAVHPIPFDGSRTYPIHQKATQPPVSTLRMGRGPRLRRGAPEQPMPKSYSSSPFCLSLQYPRVGATSSRFQDSATKVRHEAANLSFADPLLWCMRNCSKTAPGGHHSAIPPFASVSGWDGKGRQ